MYDKKISWWGISLKNSPKIFLFIVPDIKNGEKYTRPVHFFVFIKKLLF